jgi:beta-glucosidase
MNSFNELNGIPATGNAYFAATNIKRRLGFDGFVVSDWGSTMKMLMVTLRIASAAEIAINAGSDMDMESSA